MIGPAFAVFVLGLRHGADPDHLAAIDNLTRNSIERAPRLARFVGTLFAGGHSLMVLSTAMLVGYLGSRLVAHANVVESLGTWMSIVVLLSMAVVNLRQLVAGPSRRIFGMKTHLLPAAVRDVGSPWLALPVGALFGLGFETSSQIAAYTVAFGSDLAGALVIGLMFCLGLACTDTLDSVFVLTLISYGTEQRARMMRVWIASVALFAVAVAAFELAQVFGWRTRLGDLEVSATLTGLLIAVFVCAYGAARRAPAPADA